MTHVSTSREANLRGEQLELFPEGGVQAINPAHARSSVSPGWWPVVARLFAVQHAVVQECREIDGQLMVRATSAVGTDQLLQALIARIRDDCEKTCGCCGNWNATAFRGRFADVTRVVCDTCRERLRAGEAYLSIADEYWRLDGSRRPHQSRKALQGGAPRPNTENTMRECGTLGAGELRATIAAFAARLRETIVGQEDAVLRLSLILGCHVGGGLARGGRILIIGPSGVGKTSLIQSIRRALELENWNVPFAAVDAVSLTSPGWTGLTVGGVLEAALGNADPHSMRARHAVCVVDEIHHVGVVDGLHGNSLAKRQEVLASLLALFGHGTLRLGDSAREWSSANALVIALGAFTGRLDPERAPAPVDLVAAGLPLESATRFDEVLVLRRLSEGQLVALLRQWPALLSLIEVCHRLGLVVRIVEETFTRAARSVTAGGDGSTARTAGGWLVAALRGEMIRALGDPAVRELVLTPDSLAIARAAVRRRGPDDPPDVSGGWDATIVLTPR